LTLRGLLGPDVTDEEIARLGDAKEARYRELVRTTGVTLLPGVGDWLSRLAATGWRQAIASSAPRLNITTILEVLGIAPYFAAIVSGEEVCRGKPDPQVFFLAAERVQAPPSRCVVVEDSPFGIEGARRAGMKSVGVGVGHAALPADYAVPTLAALPADGFERLVPGT
jgi:beta-phosphoglucomutase